MTREMQRESFRAVIDQAAPELPYYGYVQARVLKDHGDHRVDLEPLDAALPLMTHVPYEVPFAGARCRVRPGAVLLVGFEGADPRRVHALAFRSGDLDYLRIECGPCVLELDAQSGRVVISGWTVEINS